MARKVNEMCVILALVVMVWGEANAQSQSGCTNALMGLTSCLNYVSGSSSNPSSSCCSSLSSIVQSQPRCLCSLVNGGTSYQGVPINQTLALQLPSACNVQSPSISQCNAVVNGPTTSASSPASPPSSSTTESSGKAPEAPTLTPPTVPSIPAGTGSGSKAVPSTHGSSSDGSNINAPLHLLVFVFFIMTCTSMATSS